MRNNKAILDEAARSVRRTFIGSVAGSLTMLAVVGAAGAYGMPEKLTTQALSAAMAKFNIKLPATAEPAVAVIERPVKVAENTKIVSVSPVFDVTPEEPVVRTAPQVITEAPAAPFVATPVPVMAAPAVADAPAIVAPVAAAAPVVATRVAPVAPVIEKPAVIAEAPPVEATPVKNPFTAADAEPAPTVTASLAPITAPEIAEQRPLIFAPMVFEAPKPADAQVLTTLPPTEVIVAAPQPVQQASLAVEPAPFEFPKSVTLTLPLPKPPLSPAQRLELQGKDYDKAEKCLAQAIYFEARNEPARGQQAVAQVVLNRVFSPYYPKDVCSVVYQNAHRHLSCQFTFACDGKPETVNEHGAWARASRIATQTLNAKVWLPEVDKATHYHAAYVRPNWIRDMKVMVRYGLHTFYRPRNWGDGSNEAHWGTAANTVKSATVAAKPAAAPAAKKVALRKT